MWWARYPVTWSELDKGLTCIPYSSETYGPTKSLRTLYQQNPLWLALRRTETTQNDRDCWILKFYWQEAGLENCSVAKQWVLFFIRKNDREGRTKSQEGRIKRQELWPWKLIRNFQHVTDWISQLLLTSDFFVPPIFPLLEQEYPLLWPHTDPIPAPPLYVGCVWEAEDFSR